MIEPRDNPTSKELGDRANFHRLGGSKAFCYIAVKGSCFRRGLYDCSGIYVCRSLEETTRVA